MIAAAPYLIWGVVLHLIADWPLQNEWLAQNKAKRRMRKFHWEGPWWDRHPAAYAHAGIHGAIQLLIFPWWAALFIGVTHLLIDLRTPVEWWSKFIEQTQPKPEDRVEGRLSGHMLQTEDAYPVYMTVRTFDVGMEVRFWTDQVFHIAVVAIAALVVSA